MFWGLHRTGAGDSILGGGNSHRAPEATPMIPSTLRMCMCITDFSHRALEATLTIQSTLRMCMHITELSCRAL